MFLFQQLAATWSVEVIDAFAGLQVKQWRSIDVLSGYPVLDIFNVCRVEVRKSF